MPVSSSVGSSTTAPAASARSTHVPRSVKSVTRESISAPMQRTRRYLPVCTYCDATERL
jgi:hypothetical protein